jgi:prepilin-type N-terminal cleavage/methylation domain-containing protein/prepilin-type processing-associated H-X9-DG protein
MPQNGRDRGFTLVELLVVIAIIALLVAIILLSVERFQQSARNAMDQVGQRNLIQANINYTGDYQGRWLNPMTSGDPTQHEWVKCYGNNIASGNRELVDALEEGAAWDYLGQDPKAYKSPLDPSDRVRSYSFNAQVGVRPNGYHVTGGYGPATYTFSTIAKPSETMMTIVEHSSYGYNPQGFYVGMPGTGWQGCWVDLPAFWDRRGVNIGYVDGSVRYYAFRDPSLPDEVREGDWGFDGPDLTFFEETMYPGWDGDW